MVVCTIIFAVVVNTGIHYHPYGCSRSCIHMLLGTRVFWASLHVCLVTPALETSDLVQTLIVVHMHVLSTRVCGTLHLLFWCKCLRSSVHMLSYICLWTLTLAFGASA